MSLKYHITAVVLFFVVAARTQERVPLFPKGELFMTDAALTKFDIYKDVVKHGDYVLFFMPFNDTSSAVVIYKEDSSTGDYSEVNRIYGTALFASIMTSNGEWIATFDGSTREVNFFKLAAGQQVVNNFKWGFNSLAGFNRGIRLMPDNNFVTIDYVYATLKVLIYKYASNSWASTSVFSVTTPSAYLTYLTDTGIVILDSTTSIASIYEYHGDNFTFVENVTLPFQLKKSGKNVFAYDGAQTLVFVKNTYEMVFMERSTETGEWQSLTINWDLSENAFNDLTVASFIGDKLYVSNPQYNNTEGLQGVIFEFQRTDSNWTNTAVFYPYSTVSDQEGFVTNAALGFVVTNDAVISLARALDSTDLSPYSPFQVQYVLLSCYNETFEVTCHDQLVNCDTTIIDATALVTDNKPCGSFSVHHNNSTVIALDFSSAKSVSVTLMASRFGQTAQCSAVIECSNDVAPGIAPLRAPTGSPSPVVKIPSGSVTSYGIAVQAGITLLIYVLTTLAI